MMKMIPTMQPMPNAPQMPMSIPFNAGTIAPPSADLMSSPFDNAQMKKPGIIGNNIYGGQGPANIVPDANGEIGRGSNGMRDTITRLLMGGAGG